MTSRVSKPPVASTLKLRPWRERAKCAKRSSTVDVSPGIASGSAFTRVKGGEASAREHQDFAAGEPVDP